jgi:hypothetical protein
MPLRRNSLIQPLVPPPYTEAMRYLVRARVKAGRERALLRAIDAGMLGRGSVAGDEYLRNMAAARLCDDGTARWVEICFCPTPLLEERPYWEEYFELTRVQDAHDRRRCRDYNGTGRGPASTATAPSAWSKGSRRRACRFSGRSAAMQMWPEPDRRADDSVRKGLR